MNNWQIDQLDCECAIHRYHVAHLCECGCVLDHGKPIPWSRLTRLERETIDRQLTERAAHYAEHGDGVRMSICLNERKRGFEVPA